MKTKDQNVRCNVLNWWNKLDKMGKRKIEYETFGEGSPCEDNTLVDADIITMYKGGFNVVYTLLGLCFTTN